MCPPPQYQSAPKRSIRIGLIKSITVPKEFTEATSRTVTASSTQTLPETILEIQESVKTAQTMEVNIPNEEKEEYLITNMPISDEEDNNFDSDDQCKTALIY